VVGTGELRDSDDPPCDFKYVHRLRHASAVPRGKGRDGGVLPLGLLTSRASLKLSLKARSDTRDYFPPRDGRIRPMCVSSDWRSTS